LRGQQGEEGGELVALFGPEKGGSISGFIQQRGCFPMKEETASASA